MDINILYNKAYTWLFTMGPRIIMAIFIFIIGWWIIKTIIRIINNHLLLKRIDASLRPFLISLISVALKILLVLTILQIIGLQLTMFAALIGAFGVAAGLALSGTLQNFTSGILILLLKPFRVGDIIIAQGQQGLVSFIRIFYTVVTTFDNRTVIIPNSKLSNEVIVNLSREGKRRMDIELKFNYGISQEQVYGILENTIKNHSELLKEPTYRLGISSIDPDGYKVVLNVWVKALNYEAIKLQLQELIIREIKSAGIKLPGMP